MHAQVAGLGILKGGNQKCQSHLGKIGLKKLPFTQRSSAVLQSDGCIPQAANLLSWAKLRLGSGCHATGQGQPSCDKVGQVLRACHTKKHAFQSWKAAGQSKRHPQLLHCLEFNGHGEVDPCAGEDGQEFDAELLHGEPSSKFRNPTRKLL